MDENETTSRKGPSPATEKVRESLAFDCAYASLAVETTQTNLLDLILGHEPHDELRLRRLGAKLKYELEVQEKLSKELAFLDDNWNDVADNLERSLREEAPVFPEG